jgi:hypothetical protein
MARDLTAQADGDVLGTLQFSAQTFEIALRRGAFRERFPVCH